MSVASSSLRSLDDVSGLDRQSGLERAPWWYLLLLLLLLLPLRSLDDEDDVSGLDRHSGLERGAMAVKCFHPNLFVCEEDISIWTDSDETWWTGWVCDKDEFIRFS